MYCLFLIHELSMNFTHQTLHELFLGIHKEFTFARRNNIHEISSILIHESEENRK